MVDYEQLLLQVVLLARLIAGEAGVCGLDGKLAVVHVYANRGATEAGWYGDAMPSELDWIVAWTWASMPDPTHGARYLFSKQDLQLPAVRTLLVGQRQTASFSCARGLKLTAWK